MGPKTMKNESVRKPSGIVATGPASGLAKFCGAAVFAGQFRLSIRGFGVKRSIRVFGGLKMLENESVRKPSGMVPAGLPVTSERFDGACGLRFRLAARAKVGSSD